MREKPNYVQTVQQQFRLESTLRLVVDNDAGKLKNCEFYSRNFLSHLLSHVRYRLYRYNIYGYSSYLLCYFELLTSRDVFEVESYVYFSGQQELRLGEQWLQYFIRNRNDASRVYLPERYNE